MQMVRQFCMALLLTGLLIPASVAAAELSDTYYTATYFHGIGCSHCANVDGVLLSEWIPNAPHLVVIEYEVFKDKANIPVLLEYNASYRSGTGVPILFFSPSAFQVGDTKIRNRTPGLLEQFETNLTFRQQSATPFRSVAIETLGGHPRLWYQDRVLIRTETAGTSVDAKELLLSRSVPPMLSTVSAEPVTPIPIPFGTHNLTFQHAVRIPGWILQWNADELARPVAEAPTPAAAAGTTTPPATPLVCTPLALILGIGMYAYLRPKSR